jgi:hypothetical protein
MKSARGIARRHGRGAAMTALALSLLAPAALAQDYQTRDQLVQLIKGNTVHAEDLASGRSFLVYHDPSGAWLLQRQDGTTVSGVWRISAEGAQCVVIDVENCGRIQKNADGTYTRVVDGTPRQKWHRISGGKAF